MAKTIAQRLTALEKMVADYFGVGKSRKASRPKAKARKTKKTAKRKAPRR